MLPSVIALSLCLVTLLPAAPSDSTSAVSVSGVPCGPDAVSAGRSEPHHLWLESGLSLGVNVLNDLPDVILDVRGLRAGIVDRHRAAFEMVWLPRVAYSFNNGFTLGLYGGLGFTGPSTPQMAIMLDVRGLRLERNRDKETGYALELMGGPFLGVRTHRARGGYLMPTIGMQWHGRRDEAIHSKLMVDLRFDVGFLVGRSTYLAVGPSVRLAAFSWGGLSASGMRQLSSSLVFTFSRAAL